jgi:hypothetical protein
VPNPRVGPTRFLRRQSAAETLNSFFLEPIFERDLITRNRVQDSRHPVNQIRSVNITIDQRALAQIITINSSQKGDPGAETGVGSLDHLLIRRVIALTERDEDKLLRTSLASSFIRHLTTSSHHWSFYVGPPTVATRS